MENHNNMYTDIEYKKIKEKYGACASWAIWDVNDLSDTTIIENNILNLQNNYVLLALNKSIDIDLYCWKNFHGYDHARKLAYGCNNSLLRGSYMTDLFKDLPEAVASRLDKNLSSNDIEKI